MVGPGNYILPDETGHEREAEVCGAYRNKRRGVGRSKMLPREDGAQRGH